MTDKDWNASIKAAKTKEEERLVFMAYSDWLEDQGRLLDAFKQREKAGLGKIYYEVRTKDKAQRTNYQYRVLGSLINRLKLYSSIRKDGRWPHFLLGGSLITDTEVIVMWQPEKKEVCVILDVSDLLKEETE